VKSKVLGRHFGRSSSHIRPPAGSAVFDKHNLVSVMELAERTGLSELIAEHVQLPGPPGRSG
jgi:hypothetical protein